MAPLVLYHFPPSAHSRGVLMAIRNFGLDVEVKIVNLFEKEQLNPEFIKLNPQHCIPTLKDGDFVMWESRPIAMYLAQSKCPDSSLYPKDIQKRAIVDQRLFFDAGTLYPSIRAICFPVLFLGETKIANDKRKKLRETLEFLEIMLNGQEYVAGDHVTIADIFILSSLASIVYAGADISEFKITKLWYEKCKSLPGYDEMIAGAVQFGNKVKSLLTDKL